MDKIDIILYPFVCCIRITLLLLSLAILVCPTRSSLYKAYRNYISWTNYITISLVLSSIYYIHCILCTTLNIAQTIWIGISFWPRFYYNLLGPSSKGRSIWQIISDTHPPDPQLAERYREKQNSSRIPVTSARHYVHSSIQVTAQNAHFANGCNAQMAGAVNNALSYSPIVDPLRLSVAYDYFYASLREPPDGLLLKSLSLISIVSIYSIILLKGFTRLLYNRLCTRLKSICGSRQQNVLPKTKKRRKHRTANQLPTIKITLLTHDLDPNKDNSSFSLSTDGIPFIIDNAANGVICNDRSLFVGLFKQHRVSLQTGNGISTQVKNVGTLRLKLTDDDGVDWTYDIPDVVYDPDSKFNILGIPQLAKFFNDTNHGDCGGTTVHSGAYKSILTWDHGKHVRHFTHGISTLPELWLYQNNTYFSAFCTRMKSYLNDKVSYAFSSAFTMSPENDTSPHIIPDDTDEDSTSPESRSDNDTYENANSWYKPSAQTKDTQDMHIDDANNKPRKRVRFDSTTRPPTFSDTSSSETQFELGMNLVYRDGNGNAEAVVYEGVSADGLTHSIRHKDRSISLVHDSNLSFLQQMSMSNIPSTPLDYCKEVGTSLSKDEAQRLARPRSLTPVQQELMSWHHRLYHLPFRRIFMLAKYGFLPKRLLQCQDKVPLCVACQFGSAHRRPWRNKGKKAGSIRRKEQVKPGDGVSVDQIISSQPGLIPQMSGFLTSQRIWGCTTFVDHVSDFVYVHLMRDFTLEETLLAKAAFEKLLAQADRQVKHYHADNGRFADQGFKDDTNDKNQKLTFCAAGAHHQVGIIENKNKILTQGARTLLLHGMRMWPQMIDSMFWPFAFKAMAERMNTLHVNIDGSTPESLLYDIKAEDIPVKTYHTLFCPVYVLDSRLQSAGGMAPKWEPRSRIGVYLGHSPSHAGSVALVFNPSTGRVSPQYHVVFDDDFTTVEYMEAGTTPPHWKDLFKHSSELATNQDFTLAESWFANESQSELAPTNPITDPYQIVSDQHNKRSGLQSSSNQTTTDNTIAVSEGEDLTARRKRQREGTSLPAASTTGAPNFSQVDATNVQSINRNDTQSVDELKMPTRINLNEAGLRRSERIRQRELESQPATTKTHVAFATSIKSKLLGLFTLFSFVSDMSMPSHQSSPNATIQESIIQRFEELNQHYDNTCNRMHIFSYLTDISTNETFTFQQAMKQDDKLDFVTAMEKEIADHESRGHWSIVQRNTLPANAKPIKAIWSFKRKRRPDGSLLKHKARICAHGGMQQWGDNYWETYSPVVNMLSVRLLLSLAKIFNLDSKAIDFVLAFPQADLDYDIWMYLPIGFQVDGVTEKDSSRYILKLNKNLYGLKQGSYNWYEKLKKGLTDRGFVPSQIDPCLYLKPGMIVLTYVDDCIIVGESMKDINEFIKSMQEGPEKFILTDEGDIDKFLGIEIKQLAPNKFEIAQPFLIDRIVNLLGLENNEFNVSSNSRSTPVGKPVLNKDLEGKPRKLKWKYRTAVGMLTYLQGNTRPELAMATHQVARFTNDPKLCHEKAIMRIGRYLLHTKERGIIFEPDKTKGLECYVDADFAGGWANADANDADNVMSRTGFVIMYANCPIYWVSKLQTEIALSTAEAEYIALSQALREVIPLMTLLEEIHPIFPVHVSQPNFICKVHEDNQSCIKMATSDKFTPRTKHIALKYHHFKSHVKRGLVDVQYCRTEDQKADLLTKPLADALFFKLRYMLCGW